MGKNEKPGELTPRTFRLDESTVEDLDLISEHQKQLTGALCNRTDALRIAVKEKADRIRKKKE